MQDPYLKLRPPKSTGREYFGASYVDKLLRLARRYKMKPADLLYTTTYFTASSVADALSRFVFPNHKIHELIVSGGSTRNPVLMIQLKLFTRIAYPTYYVELGTPPPFVSRNDLSCVEVFPSSKFNVPTDAKEALAFAVLAYETLHQRPSNIPTATGASGPAILGKISYAPPR